MAEYLAQCHCGALTARYRTEKPPEQWSIRACQCSFCRARGALSTSDPQGALRFSSASPESLQRYRFGTGSTDFLICRRCGVYLGALTARAGSRFGILNTRTLSPVPADLPEGLRMDYASETAEARYERRKAGWTPLVSDRL